MGAGHDFYVDYGDLFVRITNMSRNSIYLDTNTSENKYVSLPATSTEGKRTQLNNGDVLISITADIGIIGYIDEFIAKPAYINQHISLVRFDDDSIDNKFVAYFLASENVQKKFLANSDVGAKAGMNLNGVRSIIFAVPTIQEQSAIAEALTDVDTLIVELKKVLAKKQAIKTATMQQLLTGKTRLPQFALRKDGTVKGYKKSELGEIPEDWSIENFSTLATLRNERINPRTKDIECFCIELEHIISEYGQLNGFTETSDTSSIKNVFSPNDILFGKLRSYLKKYWKATQSGVCSTEIWVLKTELHKAIPEFIFQTVKTDRFVQTASEAYGTHMPRADWKIIKELQVATPSIEEQTAITAILSDMDKDIQTLQQRLDKTRQLKQGMMQELLTGKTRLI